jgi:hypothetical protein
VGLFLFVLIIDEDRLAVETLEEAFLLGILKHSLNV